MTQHLARAVPWWTLGCAAALLTVLLRTVEEWPYTMWPLQGIAVGFLAATATWAYDEPAAAVVDSLPRGLGWRTTVRTLPVLLLTGWWLASVTLTRTAYFGHAGQVAWQGCAAVVLSVAVVTWQRRRGVAMPARSTAPSIVLVSTFLALARPLDEVLPVFPYTAAGPWSSSTALWSCVAALGAVMLVLTLSEPLPQPGRPATNTWRTRLTPGR